MLKSIDYNYHDSWSGSESRFRSERLMRALLLQAFLLDPLGAAAGRAIDYDLSFRWFVGRGIEDAVWEAMTFTKNRDRGPLFSLRRPWRAQSAPHQPPRWMP
jgi:hypothetical protein